MVFLPKKEVLSLEELYKLCSTFIDLGVKKIRLTGGEPLVRKNVISLITNLGKHIKPGELDELENEVSDRVASLLRSLIIDVENDHNTQETAQRVSRMYINEIFKVVFRSIKLFKDFLVWNNFF